MLLLRYAQNGSVFRQQVGFRASVRCSPRIFLLIPHLIVLYLVNLIAYLLYFIATFAILFTGKYPEGMFNFVVGSMRWGANVGAYLNSLMDKYPPFSTDAQAYPVSLEADYPESSSRLPGGL